MNGFETASDRENFESVCIILSSRNRERDGWTAKALMMISEGFGRWADLVLLGSLVSLNACEFGFLDEVN